MSTYHTHILEAAKLNQFKQLAAEGHRGLFILFFNDGVLVYNIAERLRQERDGYPAQLQLQVKKNLPTHTMKERGRTEKLVAFLSQSLVFKDRQYSLHF
jgi:hypothetical protein